MGFGKYLKTAFLNRWNLLVVLGGAAFAAIGAPHQLDVLLPLILAGEIAYIGLLGTHPKFQKYVDAQEAKKQRAAGSQQTEEALHSIMRALPKPLAERFESLRAQCRELRQIAVELKHPGQATADLPLDELQLAGLDRLLWIHLRLLYTQFALGRFLQKTKDEEINSDIARIEKRLKALPADSEAAQGQRIRKALEDNLQTSRTRLANLHKARDNYELVNLEIERLENKIRSLSEMAVNRQEPEFISGQVDQVATSMIETERTMNDLKFATGLDNLDEEPPELVRSKVVEGRR